jgi:hypothetical protein
MLGYTRATQQKKQNHRYSDLKPTALFSRNNACLNFQNLLLSIAAMKAFECATSA